MLRESKRGGGGDFVRHAMLFQVKRSYLLTEQACAVPLDVPTGTYLNEAAARRCCRRKGKWKGRFWKRSNCSH